MRADLPRARRYRLLVWISASVVLHALILLAMPQDVMRTSPRVEILHVEIDRQEPPRAQRQPQSKSPPPPETSGRSRGQPKPQLEREPSPRTQPPRREKEVVAKPQPLKPESNAPAPQPIERETAIIPQRSPTPPVSAPPAADIAQPTARDAPVTAPPETPAAPAAKAQPPGSEPAPAARISDAKPLSAPVRYPRTAEQGRVTLRVLVDRQGRVAQATLERTSGYPNLDRHALEAVRRWRFAPAQKADEPVEQWLVVNVDY